MVGGHDHDVLALVAAEEHGAQERPAPEVEGAARLGRGEVPELGLPPPRRQGREIDERQDGLRGSRCHHLERLAADRGESGAQRLVAAGELAEATRQHRDRERPRQARRERDVVEGEPRLELLEEPQALLGEGERQRATALLRGERQQRGGGRPPGRGAGGLDARRDAGDRRRREQVGERDLDAEQVAQPRQRLGGEERVPAQREEVVAGPHPLDVQQLGPGGGDPLLDRRARRDELPRLPGIAGGRQAGEGAAVRLAAGVERQRRQGDEGRRQHVGRQAGGEERPQLGGERPRDVCGTGGPLGGHHVGDQAEVAVAEVAVAAGDDRAGGDRGAGEEGRLDLPGLDAEAADLHLLIDPPEELHLSRCLGHHPAHQVAGAVEPLARPVAPRVGHEALGGELRPAPVAARQALAADQQLAGGTARRQAQRRIGDVDLRPGDGAADRHGDRAVRHRGRPVAERDDRALGRPVGVDQLGRRVLAQGVAHRGSVGRLAAEEQVAEAAKGAGRLAGHPVEQRGGEEEGGDPLRGEGVRQPLGGEDRSAVDPHQAAAVQERSPHLPRRGVEGGVGDLGDPVEGPELRTVRAADQADDPPVRHPYPLRRARRAGGVEDVGQTLRRHRRRIPVRAPVRVPVRVHPHRDHRHAARPVRRTGPPLRHHQRRQLGVLRQPRQALRRIGGVERHVSPPGREDAEHADDHRRRGGDREADAVVRPHPQPAQAAGQARRPRGDLGIGHGGVGEFDGRRVRRAPGLRGEERGQCPLVFLLSFASFAGMRTALLVEELGALGGVG